jgi:hypothetical protein
LLINSLPFLKATKMTFLFMAFAFITLMGSSDAGLLTYGACQTGCNGVWVACCAAAGATAGVVTVAAAVPAAVIACNVAQGGCMAMCAALLLTPTP